MSIKKSTCWGLVTIWLSLILEPISNKCSIMFCLLYFNLWRTDTEQESYANLIIYGWNHFVHFYPTFSECIFINGLPLFLLAAELCVLSPWIVQTPLFLLIILKQLGKKKLVWWLSFGFLSQINVSCEEMNAGPVVYFWCVLRGIYNLYCKNGQRWKNFYEGADCSLYCGSSGVELGCAFSPYGYLLVKLMLWWCTAGLEPT